MKQCPPFNDQYERFASNNKDLREQIIDIKGQVHKYENHNLDSIIFYYSPTGRNWWLTGGNSALFFHEYIAPSINCNARIFKDSDNFHTFKTGTLRLQDLDRNYHEKFLKAGLKLIFKSTYIRHYRLPKKITNEELTRLRNADATFRAQINHYLKPKIQAPKVYRAAVNFSDDFCKTVIKLVNKSDCHKIAFNKADMLDFNYLLVAKGLLDPKTYFKNSLDDLQWLSAWLFKYAQRGTLERKFINRTMLDLANLKTLYKTEYEKILQETKTSQNTKPDDANSEQLSFFKNE